MVIAATTRTCHGPRMIPLAQNQLWKQGDLYFRIVVWERMTIHYKESTTPDGEEGTLHTVSKKEFCRLIRGAELIVSKPTEPPNHDHGQAL